MNKKQCPQCGETFYRRPEQRRRDFERQKCCSKSCGAKERAASKQGVEGTQKVCVVCNTTFYREDMVSWKWRKKKTCSQKCAGKLSYENRLNHAASNGNAEGTWKIALSNQWLMRAI